MAERKEILRIGPGGVLPKEMPSGISQIIDVANDKVYVEDANGGKREFVEGGTATRIATTAPLANTTNDISTRIQGGRLILNGKATASSITGLTYDGSSLCTVDSAHWPSAHREFIAWVFDDSAITRTAYIFKISAGAGIITQIGPADGGVVGAVLLDADDYISFDHVSLEL